jgi:aminopeptidase N
MRDALTALVHREHYTAPAYFIRSADLSFDLDPVKTIVGSKLRIERNPAGAPADGSRAPLRLQGEGLNLLRVQADGQSVSFRHEAGELVIDQPPEADSFLLEIRNTCAPDKNTELSGLYTSNGGFFTQCEAEGFRRITFFADRPDVMAVYTVTLRADKSRYPVLLSNGNLVEEGALEEPGNKGRHFAKWHDPFPKPSYLFALVAGRLVAREQRIRSRGGRDHLLQVYVRPGDLEKTEHAMNSLVASVIWDEARYGLALDLDRFMVVGVDDFNGGAMENKGLNLFNTRLLLASAATASDSDFAAIESVIAHEYFHNWTGNRITCRDWFQLSLKEGLTVFRDQEFSQDMCSDPSARAVKRIEDVRVLRTAQFPEDAGPMAHPVRPDSYIEINNFYTVTIYEKGAEVVRMMQTLVGRDGFAKGMKLYFERFDGQAVTCDDFAQSMADANPGSSLALLLPQFKLWYSQAGTPRLTATGNYNAAERTYTLEFKQRCAATANQPVKQAFVIPVLMGLVGSHSGAALALTVLGSNDAAANNHLFVMTGDTASITFTDVAEEPVPSILRGFSAPVVLDFDYTDAQLLTLLANDPDPFNRWEAGQRLALRSAINAIAGTADSTGAKPLNDAYLSAMRNVLRHPKLDAAFKELVLTLPSETYIAEQLDVVDPQRIHAVREAMRSQIAVVLQPDWAWAFDTHQEAGAYCPDATSAGRRALVGMALSNLCLAATQSGDAVWPGKALQGFKDAGNMTDRANALQALVGSGHALAAPALARFQAMFKQEDLVLDKWFAMQAGAPDRGGNVLPAVRQLMTHPDFNIRNPNRARSVIFSYCNANPGAFHRTDAAGYVYWSERVVELDGINPQVAARLARALDRWKRLAEPYRSAACEALKRVSAKTDLSNDVREVIDRALAD